MSPNDSSAPYPSRRSMLRLGAALPLATTLPGWSRMAHSGTNDSLRIGLIGCGGRGTGAAANALRADPDVKLWAMGDAFSDMLENSLANLEKAGDLAGKIDVSPERRFTGFDAYRQVIDQVDVVLLATSPHFRPLHVEYAVEQGKHLFVEKPVAVDAPGLRRIEAACKRAAEKRLSLVSGLCYRYQFAKKATFERIHSGDIGEITALQCTYNTGGLWHRGHKPEWSEMEYQMRNWLYFPWLSGDHIAEQHIHSLDKMLWAMGDAAPAKVTASGGRIVRTDPKYGTVYDHFNSVYEWANGVRGFSSCRQMNGTSHDVSDYAFGTKGTAALQHHRIQGENKWRWRGDGPDDMYQNEHNALFEAIRNDTPINNGDYMIKSTMLALMARMSAYSGQTVTWEQAYQSQLDLTPPAYAWINELPDPGVARPGVTRFV